MFWHRGGNPTSPVADSAADLYPYGVNPYPTSLPVYGYPAFDSAAVYKYFYNLYMKRLQAASSSNPAPHSITHPTMVTVPKQERPKQELQRAPIESQGPSESETPASAPPAPSAVPVERADIPNAHFAQPLNPDSAKAVQLPHSSMPQRALPDQAGSTPEAGVALKVAPVGLPGYERQPMVVPQGTVKSVYPKIEVVVQPSD